VDVFRRSRAKVVRIHEDLIMFDPQPVPNGLDTEAALAMLQAEPATGALWAMTEQILHGRAGWRLEHGDDGTYGWFFGLEGQGLLAVTVEAYGLLCYHPRNDAEFTANTARELWNWARGLEEEELRLGSEYLLYLHSELRKMKDSQIEAALDAE
jgi:hypothetical protein